MTFEEFESLLAADRTVRRFDGSRRLAHDVLERLVNLTRLCASGRNAQPLKYLGTRLHVTYGHIF